MTSIVVTYKYAVNPQDTIVSASGVVNWSRVKTAVSEYDPAAVQVGRILAGSLGTDVAGISIGGRAASSSMTKKGTFSRGTDRALVVADNATSTWNVITAVSVLADPIGKVEGASLILTGDLSVGEPAKIVPILIVGFLGWSCFQEVISVEAADDGRTLVQNTAGGICAVRVDGPVVAAIAIDTAPVEAPGMKGIPAAGKKPLEEVLMAKPPTIDMALEATGCAKPVVKTRRSGTFTGDDAAIQPVATLRNAGAF